MLYEKIFPQANLSSQHQRAGAANAISEQKGNNNHASEYNNEEFAGVGIEVGAPGSLFYAPQQLLRPSSSPGQKAGGGGTGTTTPYFGSTTTSTATTAAARQRPQTVGPGHVRHGNSGRGSGSASRGGSSGSVAGLSNTSQYQQPYTQQRPLSGFDAMRYASSGATGAEDSARAKRPQTAASGYPGSSTASARSNTGGLTAEERAEDEYQRQQRAATGGGHADDEDDDDGGADVRDYGDDDDGDDGQAQTRGELDPLSDEDENQ